MESVPLHRITAEPLPGRVVVTIGDRALDMSVEDTYKIIYMLTDAAITAIDLGRQTSAPVN